MSEKKINALSFHQWLRLIAVYTLIPLVLFLSAGDIAWWQAWLYSTLFFVSGFGGRILAEQKHPGLTAERQSAENIQHAKPWDKVLAPLMAISISFPLIIVAGLDHRYSWSIEFPWWLNLTGFIFISMGYAFGTWALIENKFFSSVVRIQLDRGHKVCKSGPYQFIRHPGYAGVVLASYGIVLAMDSIWSLIPATVALVIAVIRTELEDKTLQKELQGYQEYAQQVRYRLIPGIY